MSSWSLILDIIRSAEFKWKCVKVIKVSNYRLRNPSLTHECHFNITQWDVVIYHIRTPTQFSIELGCGWWVIAFRNVHYIYDVIKWKHFPCYWPSVREIHWSPVNSPHKSQWRGALMFSLICALNKRLSKQSWGWWLETPSRPLWRNCNVVYMCCLY